MYVDTPMMQNIGFENRVQRQTRRPSYKVFLLEWKWILIGLQGFIDRFLLNSFAPKSRYVVQNTLRVLLESAIS